MNAAEVRRDLEQLLAKRGGFSQVLTVDLAKEEVVYSVTTTTADHDDVRTACVRVRLSTSEIVAAFWLWPDS